MSEIINIGAYSPVPPAQRAYRSANPTGDASQSEPIRDTVELSDFGRALAEAADSSTFRLARVRAVRGEIQRGVYFTTERINGTADRLLDVLG